MKLFKLIAFFLCTATLFSQSISSNGIEKSFIEVVGKAEKEIVPDEIYIDICIKERIEKGKKLTIEYLENQLKNELKNIGIPEENLSISDVNAVLSKTGWWKEEVLSLANYSLKVQGAATLKKVFERLDELKITQANITKATHSNIVSLRKENRIAAIKAAKGKADYLLTAIGEKTGKPIEIREMNTHTNQEYARANFVSQPMSYKSFSKVKTQQNNIVQFEKIKISTSIYVKFNIK